VGIFHGRPGAHLTPVLAIERFEKYRGQPERGFLVFWRVVPIIAWAKEHAIHGL
jgi:hypothetical protein